MQRWCSIRQVGLWHGRHSTTLRVSMVAASGLSGAQCHGLVGPKMPTVGVPIAADTCTRPESFDTVAVASFMARIALRRSFELRSSACGPASRTICTARGLSCGLPSTHTDIPALARLRASSAKCSTGQRLLGPTAPGAKATTGRSVARPRFARHCSASSSETRRSGTGQSFGNCASRDSASAPQRSIMRGNLRSPQRRSFNSTKRASPAKPVRSGMPARYGASAAFQVRGITRALP